MLVAKALHRAACASAGAAPRMRHLLVRALSTASASGRAGRRSLRSLLRSSAAALARGRQQRVGRVSAAARSGKGAHCFRGRRRGDDAGAGLRRRLVAHRGSPERHRNRRRDRACGRDGARRPHPFDAVVRLRRRMRRRVRVLHLPHHPGRGRVRRTAQADGGGGGHARPGAGAHQDVRDRRRTPQALLLTPSRPLPDGPGRAWAARSRSPRQWRACACACPPTCRTS